MNIFQVDHIALTILGYPLSYIELIATVTGLISVYYASRANVLTWPTGIINEAALFILFYQVQLYADMLLQVYFFIVTLFGWRTWKNNTAKVPVTSTGNFRLQLLFVITLLATAIVALLIMQLHRWLPFYFTKPSSYPFADAFIMVASIIATVLLAKKQIETWYFWLAVDLVSILLYLTKGIYFLSAEYLLFAGLVFSGLLQWRKKMLYA
ncbi:MAG: nicotinamide mononucleotide transporter [Chitinophagaceae bacterium]|nr:nicotinamide mononucleotide transporter [Chitinophagaceae bacterium]